MKVAIAAVVVLTAVSCSPYGEEERVVRWVTVEDLPRELALFETVFWEPRDTISLRKLMRRTYLVRGKKVLEIGTGSGLLALCALQRGAAEVIATDVNPNAIDNSIYNAKLLNFTERFEARLVPLSNSEAFSVIKPSEKFDLILSNPPWEDQIPEFMADLALYDANFRLLWSFLAGLKSHLNPGGRALLAYGSVDAIYALRRLASELNLKVSVLNDRRNLEKLPDVFLPAMVFEVTPRSWVSPAITSN